MNTDILLILSLLTAFVIIILTTKWLVKNLKNQQLEDLALTLNETTEENMKKKELTASFSSPEDKWNYLIDKNNTIIKPIIPNSNIYVIYNNSNPLVKITTVFTINEEHVKVTFKNRIIDILNGVDSTKRNFRYKKSKFEVNQQQMAIYLYEGEDFPDKILTLLPKFVEQDIYRAIFYINYLCKLLNERVQHGRN